MQVGYAALNIFKDRNMSNYFINKQLNKHFIAQLYTSLDNSLTFLFSKIQAAAQQGHQGVSEAIAKPRDPWVDQGVIVY